MDKKKLGCVGIIAILYGVIVNFYLITHYACMDCLPPLAQANYVAPWLLGSTVFVALALVIFTQRKRFAFLMLPGVIIFLLWYGQSWLPHETPSAEGTEITAATFNIYRHNDDINRIVEIIREIDADVIALEEVNPELEDLISTDLADLYPHTVVDVREGYEGMALLSRFPILESKVEAKPRDNEDVDLEHLTYIRAVLDVQGQQIVVYVVHPPIADVTPLISYNDKFLREEVQKSIDAIKQETLPVLLLCDCNSVPLTRQHVELEKILNDAFASTGRGLGLSFRLIPGAPLGLIRIDYLWHSDDFVPIEVKVWRSQNPSDHFPVWGRFVLKDA